MSVAFTPPVASIPLPAFAPGPYIPADDSVAVEIFFSAGREARLKEKYGWGTGLPKMPREACPGDQLARADALRRVGLGKRADRAELCNRVGELFWCGQCGRVYKRAWGCALRSCPNCAKRIFARAFSELLCADKYIPAALASLPGYGWKILDLTFRHDGHFPSREEMREMRRVVNRVVDRAVHEACLEMIQARKGCSLRYFGCRPMLSPNGWPMVTAPDGSVRELVGWVVVLVGGVGKVSRCIACCSRVKKMKGEDAELCPKGRSARLCPECGPVLWPDWEDRQVDTRRWRLRFGILHIAVSEFGYSKETGGPNFNYHFHGCFFGPFLDQARLVEIFLVESTKAALGRDFEFFVDWFRERRPDDWFSILDVGSRGVLIAKSQRGYRSVLAHALKYTEKLPATTPEGLAAYEKILVGVRRYALRGFLQGVNIKEEELDVVKCPECRTVTLNRIAHLGVIPLSEIEDIPFLPEVFRAYREQEDFSGLSDEMVVHAPRAPC